MKVSVHVTVEGPDGTISQSGQTEVAGDRHAQKNVVETVEGLAGRVVAKVVAAVEA